MVVESEPVGGEARDDRQQIGGEDEQEQRADEWQIGPWILLGDLLDLSADSFHHDLQNALHSGDLRPHGEAPLTHRANPASTPMVIQVNTSVALRSQAPQLAITMVSGLRA